MATIERTPRQKHKSNVEFAEEISARIKAFDIHPVGSKLIKVRPIADLRRSGLRRGDEEGSGFMTLVDVDGVLRWELGTGPVPSRLRRRRRERSQSYRLIPGEPVKQFKFKDLPPNLIGKQLAVLDSKLNAKMGLRLVSPDDGKVQDVEVTPDAKGPILLFVHGTFSNCDQLVGELRSTEPGRDLFDDLLRTNKYTQVLAFNHPTLSTTPILNAAELARLFRGSAAEVDVICHSRGGLVSRWWRECLDQQPNRGGRTLFAGSPLAGTGLAAPARLKESIDLLTNISEVVRRLGTFTGAAMSFGTAAAVLFGFFGKIISLASKTPVIDAGVQMIPGLAAQSREGANAELLSLRDSFKARSKADRKKVDSDYFFLTSNFETIDPGWKVWRYFRRDKMFDIAANVLFKADNDLVVDTSSMTDFLDDSEKFSISKTHIEPFGGTNDRVHHLNYFQQESTFRHIRKSFLQNRN